VAITIMAVITITVAAANCIAILVRLQYMAADASL
jgi:hypothetical protein